MDIRFALRLMSYLRTLRRHERWTRPQLVAYQADALHRLRDYAYRYSSFYRRFHAGLFNRPLQELPVLHKATLMEHFDELVTDQAIRLEDVRRYATQECKGGRFLDHYRVNATAGSGGSPGLFLFDEPEWLAILASFARGHEWAGASVSLTHRMRMASVASGSPWHMSAQVGASLKCWWMSAQGLAACQLLPELVRQLNDWQPDMLTAYASIAGILADEQLAGRLNIHPHLVFTSSEVLTDEMRGRIRAAWGHQPFNQYDASEAATIAAEHRHCRRMHLFEDMLIIEVVDEHYRPVPSGEYGAKVLVTTLFSRTQPLIRYELNDSVRLVSASCVCGLPFAAIDDIQGCTEDALHLPGETGSQVVIRPFVIRRVMDTLAVSGWQVVQEADDSLTVWLAGVRDGLADECLVAMLSHALVTQGTRVLRIQVSRVPTLPKSTSGKTPLIKAHRPAATAG